MNPPFSFGTRHLSAIRLVVISEEMQYAVKHEDAKFIQAGVSKLSGLDGGSLYRDGKISQRLRIFVTVFSRKGEDIGCVVESAKISVQPPESPVACDKASERARRG
jgi:hypothetical protein